MGIPKRVPKKQKRNELGDDNENGGYEDEEYEDEYKNRHEGYENQEQDIGEDQSEGKGEGGEGEKRQEPAPAPEKRKEHGKRKGKKEKKREKKRKQGKDAKGEDKEQDKAGKDKELGEEESSEGEERTGSGEISPHLENEETTPYEEASLDSGEAQKEEPENEFLVLSRYVRDWIVSLEKAKAQQNATRKEARRQKKLEVETPKKKVRTVTQDREIDLFAFVFWVFFVVCVPALLVLFYCTVRMEDETEEVVAMWSGVLDESQALFSEVKTFLNAN